MATLGKEQVFRNPSFEPVESAEIDLSQPGANPPVISEPALSRQSLLLDLRDALEKGSPADWQFNSGDKVTIEIPLDGSSAMFRCAVDSNAPASREIESSFVLEKGKRRMHIPDSESLPLSYRAVEAVAEYVNRAADSVRNLPQILSGAQMVELSYCDLGDAQVHTLSIDGKYEIDLVQYSPPFLERHVRGRQMELDNDEGFDLTESSRKVYEAEAVARHPVQVISHQVGGRYSGRELYNIQHTPEAMQIYLAACRELGLDPRFGERTIIAADNV